MTIWNQSEVGKNREMRTNVSDEAWELLKSQTAPLQLPAKARQRNAAAITRLDGDLRKQHTHTTINRPASEEEHGGSQTSQPISSECIRAPGFHPHSNMASSK